MLFTVLPVSWTQIWCNNCEENPYAKVQNHKCNEVENAFPIFEVSRLVRVHTDSHHNGHNKMIFAVSYVW